MLHLHPSPLACRLVLSGKLAALPALDRFQAALLSRPALQAVVAGNLARRT